MPPLSCYLQQAGPSDVNIFRVSLNSTNKVKYLIVFASLLSHVIFLAGSHVLLVQCFSRSVIFGQGVHHPVDLGLPALSQSFIELYFEILQCLIV